MGKGTDNKIRKNLIISCLVDLVGEQLSGDDVDSRKSSVKEQLEENLSAKLVVKIIQDLHDRLEDTGRAQFAFNLLADVQHLQNGKVLTSNPKLHTAGTITVQATPVTTPTDLKGAVKPVASLSTVKKTKDADKTSEPEPEAKKRKAGDEKESSDVTSEQQSDPKKRKFVV